jgi:hypothetical protein
VIAKLLLNHAVSDELTAIYDHGDYWRARVEAAGCWADHVMGSVEGGSSTQSWLISTRMEPRGTGFFKRGLDFRFLQVLMSNLMSGFRAIAGPDGRLRGLEVDQVFLYKPPLLGHHATSPPLQRPLRCISLKYITRDALCPGARRVLASGLNPIATLDCIDARAPGRLS